MSEWAAKRFWSEVSLDEGPSDIGILLDGRAIRTPAKALLRVPTPAFAEALAEEWRQQEGKVDPLTMPLTRMANSAIDKVAPQAAAVAAHIAQYGAADLLCYRAPQPEALIARQSQAWDPYLDWAAARFGHRAAVTTGVMPVAQDPRLIAAYERELSRFGPFDLAAFNEIVTLAGSLVLGFCAVFRPGDPAQIWRDAHLDEAWQAEQWGEDDEAQAVSALKEGAFLSAFRAAKLLDLSARA